MTDEETGKGKKKGKRMVITNVRVTEETHLELKTLADLRGKTMSEAISQLIREAAPDVIEEVRRRQEAKRKHNRDNSEQN